MPDLPEYPYKGLNPYTEADADFFFGRDSDRDSIINSLKVRRLTILYGESGVGKSSVLRASVASKLRQEAKNNLGQKKKRQFAVVVFPPDLPDLEKNNQLPQKYLSWEDEPIAALKKQIEEDIKKTIPKINKSPNLNWSFTKTLQKWIEGFDEQEGCGELFIILDQFEEYFLYHPKEGRAGTFAMEFPRAVNKLNLRVNFLISIREDSIAKLDRFKDSIPNLFNNYLRIEHLNKGAARAAIVEPVNEYNRQHAKSIRVATALVKEVLNQIGQSQDDLKSGNGKGGLDKPSHKSHSRIEAPYLQLVMIHIWEEVQKAGLRSLQPEILNEKLGGVKKIVKSHLNEAMRSLSESEKDIAASIFQYLVTPSGTKITYPALELAKPTRVNEMQIATLLEKLSKPEYRIVRPVGSLPNQPPEARRFEIFHDVLAQPILDWRRRHLAWEKRKQALEKLQHQRIRSIKQGLAAQSLRQQRRRQDELAALLARQAYRFNQQDQLHVLAQVDDALRQVLNAPYLSNILKYDSVAFSSIAFSPDGTKLAAGGWDGNIYLWNPEQPYSEFKLLNGHEEGINKKGINKKGINAIAFSPDEEWLVSGSRDNTIIRWDLRQKHPVSQVIGGHKKDVTSVAFSPNGNLLASGSKDQTVKLWKNWHQPKHRPIVVKGYDSKGEMGAVRSLTFSRDGSKLAVGCDDGSIWLWDVQEPAQILDKEPLVRYGHKGKIRSVAFSPDGQLLVSASDDYTMRLWDMTQPHKRRKSLKDRKQTTRAKVRSVAFSPDGKMLASASNDQTIRLWKTDKLDEDPQILRGHTFNITSIAFSPDDQYLASCGWDNTVRLWDLKPPIAKPQVLSEHQKTVRAIAISPQYQQDHLLASGSEDGTVRVWNLDQPDAKPQAFKCGGRVFGVALFVSSDRQVQLLAAGSDDKIVRLWDLQESSDKLPKQFKGHKDGVSSVAFSPDGQWLASGSWDKTVRLWNLNQPIAKRIIFKGYEGSVTSVAFSSDGKLLASASDDKTVRLWNLEQPKPNAEPILLKEHSARVRSIAFSPNGQLLASASDDWTVRLWDLEKLDLENPDPKKLVHVTLRGHSAWVSSVAFSPDGKVLASGSFDRSIRLWQIDQIDWKSRKIKVYPIVLEDHNQSVTSVAFTPDGKYLASGSLDNTVRLWIASTDMLAEPDVMPVEKQEPTLFDEAGTKKQIMSNIV